ncbi:MAG: gluconokinase [Anaerolineae bacterium]|nr:gluconokinase [Anaerolineae bacterium]
MSDLLTLSIDVGSSSVRVMLFTPSGEAVDDVFVKQSYEPHTTLDGGAMIDAEEMRDRIFACIDEALEQAGDLAERIDRVATDTLVGNLMGVDDEGQAVTPVYTWADIRGAKLVDRLEEQLDAADYIRRTGCRLHTSYWPVRLLWLYEAERETFQKAACWVTFGDYLLHHLFGTWRTSISAASWTGLLNRHQLSWDEETLSDLPIRQKQLSPISNEPLQGLNDQWAQRWPALADALWFPAVGDGIASNIGAGCATPQHVAISVGTSGAMRVVVQGTPEQTPEGLFVYRLDDQRSLVGGALSNAGNLYAWLMKILKDDDTSQEKVAAIEPDSHGLMVLPFLAGERAPGWNDRAQAVFMGMTFDTEREHLVRAALEGVSYRFYQIARRLQPLMPEDAVYVASGAPVLNSPVWMQILADVLGAPVYASAQSEATIRGTAALARGIDLEPEYGTGYQPDMDHHHVYQQAIERQTALYQKLFAD